MLHQAVLDLDGEDLGAVVADDHAFLTADDVNVTVLVDIAHVAGVEPLAAVGVGLDEFACGFLVLVIAEEFHRRADADLVVEGLDFVAGIGDAREAQLVFLRAVGWRAGDDACGLRHAIGFGDVDRAVTLTQEGVDALLEGGVEHVASDEDGLQIRQVFLVVGLLHEDIPIGGHREDMLGPVFVDVLQEVLVSQEGDDHRAHAEAQRDGKGVGAIEGEDGQEAEDGVVVGRVVEGGWVGEDGVQDVLRAEHHALHCARRAAGLEQRHHLVGEPLVGGLFVSVLGDRDEVLPMDVLVFVLAHEDASFAVEPFAETVPPLHLGDEAHAVDDDHLLDVGLQFGEGQGLAGEGHDEQHLGLCSVDDFADLRGRISDVEHAGNGPDLVERIEAHQRLGQRG